MARGGQKSFIGGDAEAVDLRVGVLDRAGADARQGLPKPEHSLSVWRMVLTR